jgi:hypothetical protein
MLLKMDIDYTSERSEVIGQKLERVMNSAQQEYQVIPTRSVILNDSEGSLGLTLPVATW